MSILFNHTIVAARNKKESATFLTELFGLPDPEPFGHFLAVAVTNDVSLDYAEVPDDQDPAGHYLEIITRPYGSGD